MKKNWLLFLILLIASFLRLWQLGSIPLGMTWDEAALGYNAFSISKTLRDEHGFFLPSVFKSFGDYKPGLYVYLIVPVVSFFGLSEFSTRLPSAIAGIFAVYGVYLITNQLFTKFNLLKKTKLKGWYFTLGHFAALILAIAPWHIYFSRMAWEVNVFITLLVFSLFFLHKALNEKDFPLWPSVILATLTLFIYQAAKMLTPSVFLFTLLLYYHHSYKKIISLRHSRLELAVIAFCSALVLSLFLSNLTGAAGNRLSRLSIFNYNPPRTDTTIFGTQKDLHLRLITSRYINHFSPEILFYDSPVFEPRAHLPYQGLLYLYLAPLIILGLFVLVRFWSKESQLILFLTFLAPVPASLTLAEFSPVRALFLVIPFSILAGLGLAQLLRFKVSYFFIPIFLLNTILGLDLYFNHSHEVFFKELNAGYKAGVEAIKNNPSDKVVFTDVYGQPYIYYLFYTAYDPKTYQQNRQFVDGGVDVGFVPSVANVEFHQFDTNELKTKPNTLFIGTEGNLPNNFDYTQPHIYYYQDVKTPEKGELIFRIVKTQ